LCSKKVSTQFISRLSFQYIESSKHLSKVETKKSTTPITNKLIMWRNYKWRHVMDNFFCSFDNTMAAVG